MTDGTDVLDYLRTRGRKLMLGRFKPRSCVASTRIGVEVARRLGMEAWPLAVKVDVLNDVAYRAVVAAGETGELPDQDRVAAAGGKVLSVEGTGQLGPQEWDGHLVVMVRDSAGAEVLVDLSADQFSKPSHDIALRPFYAKADRWPLLLSFGSEPPLTWIVYRRIGSRSFRQAVDWTHRDRWEDLVDQMVEEIGAGVRMGAVR